MHRTSTGSTVRTCTGIAGDCRLQWFDYWGASGNGRPCLFAKGLVSDRLALWHGIEIVA